MTEHADPIAHSLDTYVSASRVADLTAALIRCDTSNPPGDERAVIALLVDTLTEAGFTTTIFDASPVRPSVLATAGLVDGSTPIIMVNGHIDVVPARSEEWQVDPFEGVVETDRVVGRGACDMKGGIAAAIEGFRACRDADVAIDCGIVFHLVADEETGGQFGTIALADAGLIVADACIVPEPNELHVGIAERGTLVAEIEVEGRAGHGSDPARGHSAIADAARIVTELHLADFGGPIHPLLGQPSCNVGTIAGGTAANVVASRCTVTVDRRTIPGQNLAQVTASLTDKIDRLDPPVRYGIRTRTFVEASEMPPDHPFSEYMTRTALGRSGSASIAGSLLGSDARILRNRLGIPTVIYGPGSMTDAHTAGEWVGIDDLVRAAKTFARVFASFGTQTLTRVLTDSLDPDTYPCHTVD
ncbi:M20 family metallopeptidase [Rhodococcus globerulus]|uniref:Probable succinyl-diaminopimelate desuccinylase n=1 Tax=Rhodococcus globerulus TaxID=33008 RepID=A0ABU4C2K3_RHOGO|nr:ArgE/DapE family deacylase [Rhodococcus globerulus]MDV6270649.1 ArgE/DapE family deacylase [Rhodococcus globerulus]